MITLTSFNKHEKRERERVNELKQRKNNNKNRILMK